MIVSAPSTVNGEQLTTELRNAGVEVPARGVVLVGDSLDIAAPDSAKATVEQVVSAHRAKPSPTQANRQTIEDAAKQALATNRTYLGVNSSTAAQTTAQVKALTRQNNGLIRLLLGLLDATD